MVRMKRVVRLHPIRSSLVLVLLVLGSGVAYAAVSMWRSFAPVDVDFSVPSAPRLHAASPDETVYRIDAAQSKVTYKVSEHLAGTEHSATGTTSGIAGDILVDAVHPDHSQVGEVVVNVEQFTSDQSLRDNRIRHEFLESERYPLAKYTATSIQGLPTQIVDGTEYHITIVGDLSVKETTASVPLDATVRREGDELHVTATANLKLSTFDVGPIRHRRARVDRRRRHPQFRSRRRRRGEVQRSRSRWLRESNSSRGEARSRRLCNPSSRSRAPDVTKRTAQDPASGSSRPRATRPRQRTVSLW